MDVDRVVVEVGELGRGLDQLQRHLRCRPDIESVRLQVHCRVHRLQRRVREVRCAVFDLERAIAQVIVDVTVVAEPAVAVIVVERRRDCVEHRRGVRRVAGRLPLEANALRRLDGAPRVVGDHGCAAGHRHDGLDTAARFGVGRVERHGAGTERRVRDHSGVTHAGTLEVDAVHRGTGRLGHRVEPAHRLAEVAPFAAGLQ